MSLSLSCRDRADPYPELRHPIIAVAGLPQGSAFATDASGKLDVVLALDPHPRLVTIGVRMNAIDLEDFPQDVKKGVAETGGQLNQG